MPRMPSALAPGTLIATQLSGAIRIPNSAIDGMVWIRLSTFSTPARNRSTRWQRIPSGTPTIAATRSDPTASRTCRNASAQKASARLAYSLRIERLAHSPDVRKTPTAASATASKATRVSGFGLRRAIASAAIRAKANTSTQKPDAGAMRA